jgi:hypothetical protein
VYDKIGVPLLDGSVHDTVTALFWLDQIVTGALGFEGVEAAKITTVLEKSEKPAALRDYTLKW